MNENNKEIRDVLIRVSRKLSNRIDTSVDTLEIAEQIEDVLCGINDSFDRMEKSTDRCLERVENINSSIRKLTNLEKK